MSASTRSARAAVALLVLCAGARALRRGGEAAPPPAHAPAALPGALLGVRGRALAASPAEARLAAQGRLRIARRAYGSTHAALLTLDDGIKELHPPAVCLRAAGFEIVAARDEPIATGCARALRVRDRQGRLQHFYFAFVTGTRTECSFAARTAGGIWRQLTGRKGRELLLQVMDRDRRRARRAFVDLLAALRVETTAAANRGRS